MPDSDFRRFLKDLALLLIPAAIGLGALLAWWHPWEPWRGYQAFRAQRRAEEAARTEGLRDTTWAGLRLHLPSGYAFSPTKTHLEVLETLPEHQGNNRWPSRMAFLPLDSAAQARFGELSANCDLAPGRCWTDTIGGHMMACQRSAGMPDPTLEWTPHLECHVLALRVRIAVNAPQSQLLEYKAIFDSAVSAAALAR